VPDVRTQPLQRSAEAGPRRHPRPADASATGGRPPPRAAGPPSPEFHRSAELSGGQSSLVVALIAVLSAVAGAATLVLGPLQHRATIRFAVDTPAADPDALAPYRAHLLEAAWRLFDVQEAERQHTWQVVSDPQSRTLAVHLLTENQPAGQTLMTELAERYLALLRTESDEAFARATQGERILRERLARLRAELSRAVRLEQDAYAALPAEDPAEQRRLVGAELDRHRQEYISRRSRVRQAAAELADLQHAPLPDRFPVEADRRHSALRADVALQQDLAELRVRLAAARTQLLNVWQATSPLLEELTAAATALEQILAGTGPGSAAHRVLLERAAEAGADYHRSLAAFSERWNRQFVTLRQHDVDPLAPRVLEVRERTRDLLADFLFECGPALIIIRDQVRALNELSEDQARHHTLTARLIRSFHRLRTAHRQFEFSASNLRSANNPRLATAIDAAEGLRRRTLLRRRQIEDQLQREARAAELEQRASRTTLLEQEIRALRDAGAQDVDTIFELHDRFGRTAPLVEASVRRQADAAAAHQCVERLTAEISNTEEDLAEQVAARHLPLRADAVQLTDQHVEAVPVHLERRFAFAWAVGATTCLTLLLGHRLIRGRRRGGTAG